MAVNRRLEGRRRRCDGGHRVVCAGDRHGGHRDGRAGEREFTDGRVAGVGHVERRASCIERKRDGTIEERRLPRPVGEAANAGDASQCRDNALGCDAANGVVARVGDVKRRARRIGHDCLGLVEEGRETGAVVGAGDAGCAGQCLGHELALHVVDRDGACRYAPDRVIAGVGNVNVRAVKGGGSGMIEASGARRGAADDNVAVGVAALSG